MNDPTDREVGDLLVRTARDLHPVDLVEAALIRAHRVRRRRRTGLVAAMAVGVAVVVAVSVTMQPRAAEPGPVHEPPAPKAFRAPRLHAGIIEAPLVGRTIHAASDARLPDSLTPHDALDTPPGRALVVTKERDGDQHAFYALDQGLRWHRMHVDAPADIGNGLGPMLDPDALSPDGTEVALRGARFMYVVDLATGKTLRRRSGGGARAHWTGDHTLRIAPDFRTQETSAGDTMIRAGEHGFTERVDGLLTVRAEVPVRDSYEASNLVATDDRLAMEASPTFAGRKQAPGPGVLVLARPGYRGVAFLPAGGSDGVPRTVVPRGWLDRDHLVLSAADDGDGPFGPEYLVWDIASGKVSRIGTAMPAWDSSWARELLAR